MNKNAGISEVQATIASQIMAQAPEFYVPRKTIVFQPVEWSDLILAVSFYSADGRERTHQWLVEYIEGADSYKVCLAVWPGKNAGESPQEWGGDVWGVYFDDLGPIMFGDHATRII